MMIDQNSGVMVFRDLAVDMRQVTAIRRQGQEIIFTLHRREERVQVDDDVNPASMWQSVVVAWSELLKAEYLLRLRGVARHRVLRDPETR